MSSYIINDNLQFKHLYTHRIHVYVGVINVGGLNLAQHYGNQVYSACERRGTEGAAISMF